MNRGRVRPRATAIPIFRMVSLLFMLMVIGLTICHLRGRAPVFVMGREAHHEIEPAEKTASPPPNGARGIADQDPQELQHFRRESEPILDKATVIHAFELPAYWRVLNWVQSQSLAELRARGFPEVAFHELIHYPEKYRGRPVRVELQIRRVLSFEVERGGKEFKPKTLYELWGWPTESDGWLYVVVAPELPQGFPLGKSVEVTTTVYGYFFKLQGYQPADALPQERPLVAPLLMGRVVPVSRVVVPASQSALSGIVLLIGCVVLAIVIVGWMVAARRKRPARRERSVAWPDPLDEAEYE